MNMTVATEKIESEFSKLIGLDCNSVRVYRIAFIHMYLYIETSKLFGSQIPSP